MSLTAAKGPRPTLALLVAMAMMAGAPAMAQGGLGFVPDELEPSGQAEEAQSPASEPGPEYDLPEWVPRHPNSNRPYWLPPEEGQQAGAAPPEEAPPAEQGLFSPPPPPPPPPPPAPPKAESAKAAEPAEFEGEVLNYFMFTDDQGVTHLTDAPVDPRYRLFTIQITVSSDRAPYRRLNLDNVRPFILKASSTYKVDPALVTAIIKAESAFDPKAISWAGAKGLMQLMPNTARLMGVADSFDPEQNIMGGTRYIRMMLNRFDGDVVLAVAAYNCGPERVARAKAVPEIRETKNYVKTVLRNYEMFLQVFREDGGQDRQEGGGQDGVQGTK